MKASDIPDYEPLMVVAATCDYGWEFMAADGWGHPFPPTNPLSPAAALYASDLANDRAAWEWSEYHGGWKRFTSYTHGGPPDSGIGATRWGIGQELWEYPEKVLLAKLRALVRRGLLDGCACGCRGDFEITNAGRALIQ